MTENKQGQISREELRGNDPGKLRGNDAGELRDLKEYPDLCKPGNNINACKGLSNPGIDGMEGVYKKIAKQQS